MISALGREDDRNALAIIADALQAEGDAHGQLIALHLRGLHDRRLEIEHEALIAHVLDANDSSAPVELEWRDGFVRTLRLGGRRGFDRLAEQLVWWFQLLDAPLELVPALPWREGQTIHERQRVRRLLARPLTLHIGPWEIRPQHTALWTLLRDHPLPRNIDALVIDDVPSSDNLPHQITWVDLGNLDGVWPSFAHLRRLHLRGSYARLGEIVAPELRAFTLESSTFNDVERVLSAQWPKLETLSLAFGDGEYVSVPASMQQVRALIRELPESVRHFGLRNLPFTDELIPVLAASRTLPHLTTLDLSLGVLFGAEEVLLEHAAAFRHLRQLDVTHTGLDETGLEHLRAAIPGLFIEPGSNPKYGRYVSISE